MNKKWMASIVLIASLSFVTACSASAEPEASPSASESAPASPGAEATRQNLTCRAFRTWWPR